MSDGPAVLITSGSYVSAEIAAEFGLIPPAFLPIGNRRLFQWQVAEIRKALPEARVFLSLPDDFAADPDDTRLLGELGIVVVPAPPAMTLGASLTYVILSANLIGTPLCILHGDTLLQDYPFARADAVSAGTTRTYYPWADYAEEGGRLSFPAADPGAIERQVLTGAFHLADVALFLRALARSQSRFVPALALYSEERPLAPVSGGRWSDFGHLHTYFQSRRQVTTARHFNRLEATDYFFVKSSANRTKIEAERAWFERLPDDLRIFAPDVTDPGDRPGGLASYRIEYCHLATLADLYVFGRLPVSVWRSIFDACSGFLAAAGAHRPRSFRPDHVALYHDKTIDRLDQFARDRGIDLDAEWTIDGARTPSLRRVVADLAAAVGPAPESMVSVVHGDFCFSNILFDYRTQRIRVIDPRGLDADGRPSIHGDARYETAKLSHSVVGLYDHIIAGRYRVERRGAALALALPITPEVEAVQRLFGRTAFAGRPPAATKAELISVLLFLSMLPLHADDEARQWAFLANALRLYRGLDAAAAA